MKALDGTGIVVTPFSCAAGRGYALSFDDGVAVNWCAVAADDDGRLSCARGAASRSATPSFPDEVEAAVEDQRADVPWAFAMAHGASPGPLMEALGIPHVSRAAVGAAMESAVRILSEERLDALDREGLAALAISPAKRTGALAFYSGADERAVRRRQAASSYPLLADLLSSSLMAKMAIDRSRPLAETVAQTLSGLVDGDVPKHALKRIAAARHLPESCALETVVRFMSLVPADWIPTAGPEWDAFCHASHALLEDLDSDADAVPSLVKGCGGKWTEFCARIARKGGIEGEDVLRGARQAMFSASEMIDCFAEVAVLPMAAHAGPSSDVSVTPEMILAARKTAFAMLASGRSASDLADLQRRFHQERETILGGTRLLEQERNARIRGEIEEGGWPPLTDTVQAPNGLWLVPLTSPWELKDEGSPAEDGNGVPGLGHCVGGYDSKAKKCDCHIVSVRRIDKGGKYTRVTTVEFGALQPGSDRLNVRQNLGRGNSAASAEAKDAVNWYVAACAAGAVGINRTQIKAFLDNELAPDDGVERICGYDWRERDILNAGVGPWGPFVVSGFRSMGLDAIMASPEVSSISSLISPDILLAPGR